MNAEREQMTEHSIEVIGDNPTVDPFELLTARPTGWLRLFLMLAVHRQSSLATARGVPWYRLGASTPVGSGARAARLIWWPHLGDATFQSFRGELRITYDGRQVALSLIGETIGGEAETNEAALTSLLRLIVTALGAS
jgi:hypothetical protein